MKIFKISQEEQDPFDLYEMISDANSLDEVKAELIKNKIEFNELNLKGNIILVLTYNGKKQVIDDSPSIKEASEWIWSIHDYQLGHYIGEEDEDFNKKFWENVCTPYGNNHLYHATVGERIDKIKTQGLLKMNESRGVNNVSMGDAVFTSTDETSIDAYGEVIITIDVCQMKKDGYMPEVTMEEPIQEAKLREQLAWKIGLEDFNATDQYSFDGLYETTVAIYGNIPPKYLSFS